ncbi:phosphoglycerate kinase [Candidatus Dependentiae bacterium]|nr:phosphoglycerate kinase [Candidatus Dependentiae bacterium]
MQIPYIKDINLQHKRVFLRADLNVPLENGKILQDFKLQKTLPTIKYIQKNGGKVILATHLGRPKAQSQTNFYDEKFSTKNLISWFESREYQIKLERDLEHAKILSHENFSEILLLENLRFFNGEKGSFSEKERFADILSKLADIYVNDAFGLIHRDDCSVDLLAQKFNPGKKSFGLLVEQEIKNLNKLKQNVDQPFILIVGGDKIKDKTKLLENFLTIDEKNRPKKILIGGAIAHTFLKAQGFQMGKSLINDDFLDFTKDFLQKAKLQKIDILLPKDFLVVKQMDQQTTEHREKDSIQKDDICVDIGKSTIKEFEEEIAKAKTIFTNGSMGIYTKPEFATGSKKILISIANSNLYSVAGGGDCVGAIYLFGLQDKFQFLSTGGGATLTFLSIQNPFEKLATFQAMIH